MREFVTLAGAVDPIDRGSRTLTLRVDNRFARSVYVAPEFKLLDELKPGDNITARVRESVVVSTRPGLKPRLTTDTTAEAAKKQESAAELQIAQLLTIEIDRTNDWVTYKTADNRRVIRAVADPRLLDDLKPGDVSEVPLTCERVIELQRR